MANISVKKPFYITRTVQVLEVKVKIYAPNASVPSAYQYTVRKNSYEDGVAEEMSVNISPFVVDFFEHLDFDNAVTGCEYPIGIEELVVVVNVNGTDETYMAYDAYELVRNGRFLHVEHNKLVTLATLSAEYLTINSDGIDYIHYENLDTGDFDTLSIVNDTRKLIHIPLIIDGLHQSVGDRIELNLIDSLSHNLDTLQYSIGCAYEDTSESIGFINGYGAFEFIGVIGAKSGSIARDTSSYIKHNDGLSSNYNSNAIESFVVNTGLVDRTFASVMRHLMASDIAILRDENLQYEYINLTSSGAPLNEHRNDKIINYTITFDKSIKQIPIR